MTDPNFSTEPNDPLAKQAAGEDGRHADRDDDTTGREDRSFHTSTVEANRAIDQGLGAGAREIDAERDPNEEEPQVDPNTGILTQNELNSRADVSRDDRQTPRGNDAVRDVDNTLGRNTV